jgi:phosphatidate cytidylyltransferase
MPPVAQHQTIELFAGVGLVLIVASIVGAVLKRVVAHGRPNDIIDNLNTRVKAWWVMVILIGLAFMLGRAGVMLLFLFASFAALREFITLTYTPLQYVLVWNEKYGLYSIFIPVYAFLLLPIVSVLAGDTKRFLERNAKVQWGLMICVYCLSYVPALLTLNIPGYEGRNLLLIAFLVLVAQSSDVFQYIWGRLIGERKVAPEVSPSKTIGGVIGGVASATLLGTLLWWITPFTVLEAGLMALVIAVIGFFGGLVLSAIKRDRGVKDWGDLIEGHGGMLDRLDSVVFAAPVFFHITRYGWT